MSLIYNEDFTIKTSSHIELIDITPKIEKIKKNSGIMNGIVVVYTKHTTSGIIVNENESGLKEDIVNALKKLAPKGIVYSHDRIDNNAHSHIQACMIGPSETIPIVNGRLKLGSWQSIFFAEFDGPRSSRTVIVQVFGTG